MSRQVGTVFVTSLRGIPSKADLPVKARVFSLFLHVSMEIDLGKEDLIIVQKLDHMIRHDAPSLI